MIDNHHSWRKLSYFISSENTQKYLLNKYKLLGIKDADRYSFENCYPFIHYLNHGKNYYETANLAPLSIKPVLMFYGMTQLLKACILVIDPSYPDTTAVLAHGVTTRKRKKQDYGFLEDEVKVQKNGLFTHLSSKMFRLSYIEGEKFNMYQLFKRIPELDNLLLKNERPLEILFSNKVFTVNKRILDTLNMTEQRFISFLNSLHPESNFTLVPSEASKENLSISYDSIPLNSIFLFNLLEKKYFLPKERIDFIVMPEILIHYLILYNLSMICRYETDWWGDLLHNYASKDYPYIHQFLLISFEKIPFLVYKFLMDEKTTP